jgi:predicted Rossmann fold nucleotide-binding protein DprA/Smf involved in DNA uptake
VSRGTNGLLRDGAVPITAAEDVLDELFGAGMRQVPASETARAEPGDPRLARVLEAAERLSSIAAIADATNLSSAETRAALGRLEAEGYLVRRDLGGWERTLGGEVAFAGEEEDPPEN